MAKPIIQPIFNEWWERGNIVVTSNQQREDIKLAFHVGIHVGLGLIARANRMHPVLNAEEFVRQIMAEVDATLKPAITKGKIGKLGSS